MTEEGKDEEVVIQPDNEGKITPDKEGKFPKVVPWDRYVGIKESLGKKLTTAEDKVKSLEEQLSKAVKQDDFNAVQTELEKVKVEHQKVQDDMKAAKDKGIQEMRGKLKARGIPEDQYADAGEVALSAMIKVLDSYKPRPDLDGAGGGSGTLQGVSPGELARRAYASK